MKRLLPYLHSMVFLLSTWPATAQNLIFYQKTTTDAFLVKLSGGDPSHAITDHFIERLATSAHKPATSTEYIIAQDEYVRLTKVNPTQYDVYVTLGNTRLTGDTQYRGFSLAEQLKPTGVRFTLQQVNSGQVLQSFPFGEVALTSEPSLVANFRVTDSTGQFTESTVRLADKQLLYSSAAKGAFDRRVILIEDYYASIPKVDALSNEIKTVSPDDFEHLESQQTALNQYSKRLNGISAYNFPAELRLSTQDPANFLIKFNALSSAMQDLTARLNKTKSEVPERYYQRGLTKIQQSKPDEANKDFLEAVRLKPTFAPAHLELAKLRFREGNIPEAKSKLITIVKDCHPDDQTRAGATQLGTTIYQSHLTAANASIQEKKFSSSLQTLSEARSLCTELKLTCTPQLEELASKAHTAIFLSKVDSAQVLFSAAKYEDAETKATEAMEYQRSNPTYVKDALPALKALADAQTKIYLHFIQTASALADNGKLQDAEAEARKAIAYQKSRSTAIAEPSAATAALLRIKGLQYKDEISKGKAFNLQRQFRQALPLLEDAIMIETEFAVYRDPSLWSMAQAAAKPIILEDYTKGQELAKANRLADARSIGQGAMAMTERYRLQSDSEILKAAEGQSRSISTQECINAQNEFDALVKEAGFQQQMKQFIEATASYDKALQLASRQGSCGMDLHSASEGKSQISLPTAYQHLMVQSEAEINGNESKRAIDTYNQAGDLAARENLAQRFGLTHSPLHEYILESGHLGFTLFGSQHLLEKKQYDEAVELLHKVVQMGASKTSVKELMKRLGTELALRDQEAAPLSNPKVKILEYTRGNKNFRSLSKAYLKAR